MAFLGIAQNTKFLAAAPVRNGVDAPESWELPQYPQSHMDMDWSRFQASK